MCVQSRRVQVCTCRNARRLIETPRTFKLRKFTNKFVRRPCFFHARVYPPLFFLFLLLFFPPSDLPNELERIHRRPLFSPRWKIVDKRIPSLPLSRFNLKFLEFCASWSRRGCNDNSPREIASFPGSLSISPSIRFHLKGRPCSHKEET